MPELAMASAICRISDSLMLQPNVFQLFHPIGGVRATPFSRACAAPGASVAAPGSRSSAAASMVVKRLMDYRLVQIWLVAPVQVDRTTGLPLAVPALTARHSPDCALLIVPLL